MARGERRCVHMGDVVTPASEFSAEFDLKRVAGMIVYEESHKAKTGIGDGAQRGQGALTAGRITPHRSAPRPQRYLLDQMKTQHPTSLAVVAVDWTGHRLAYLAAVLVRARDLDLPIVVVVDPQAVESSEWATFVAPLLAEPSATARVVERDWSGESRQVFGELASDHSHLIVLEADHYLDDLAVMMLKNRSVRVTAQLMREPRNPLAPSLSPGERLIALAKTPLLLALGRLSSGRCDLRLLTSPLFGSGPIAGRLIRMGAVRPLIDPVLTDRVLSQRSSELSDQQVRDPSGSSDSVAVIGKIDERKSVSALLKAWIVEPRLHAVRLELCGSGDGDPGIWELIHQARDAGATVEFPDRFVSDAEIDVAIATSSAVICAYTGDIPSGVAALALDGGCPVIAFSDTRLGDALEQHTIGVAVADLSPATLLQAIERAGTLDREQIAHTATQLHDRATTSVFATDLLAQAIAGRST